MSPSPPPSDGPPSMRARHRSGLRPRRGPRGAAALVLVAAVVVAGLAVLAPPPAAAAGSPEGTISLVHETPWVRTTAGMRLEVAVSSPVAPGALAIGITLYSQATERGYFEQTLSGDTSGFQVLDAPTVLPLSTKGLLLGDGDASIDLPVSAPGLPGPTEKAPRDGALLTLPCTSGCPGVYPLQVSLEDVDDATTLDSFMTYLVVAPSAATSPLRFSLVLPVGASPATTPLGTTDPDPSDEAELTRLESALSSTGSVSVSVALYPQFAASLEAAETSGGRAGAAAKTAAAATEQLAALPNVQFEATTYTPVDLEAFWKAKLPEQEIDDQLHSGATALDRLRIHPDPRVFVADEPFGDLALPLIERAGITHLLVPSAGVAPVPSSWIFPVWAPFLVKGSGVDVDGSDYGLEQHLQSSSDPALRADQLLADLAELYFDEQPDEARGVSLLAPGGWAPSTAFLDTLVSGLASSPIVRSVSLTGLFDQVSPGSAETPILFRTLQAQPVPTDGQLTAGSIAAARSRLASLDSLMPGEPEQLARLHTMLLLAETARLAPGVRAAYLASSTGQLNTEASRLSLPTDHTITITSLTARIPISIYSRARTALHVQLLLSSEELGFRHRSFPLVLQPGNNTVEIQVFARTAGDFPLLMTLETTTGAFSLGQGNLLIRSTAISAVAVGLTIGAGLFLLAWWARSALKRRRRGSHHRGGAASNGDGGTAATAS